MTHLKGHTTLQKQFIKDRVSVMDSKNTFKVYRYIEDLEGNKIYCPKCNSEYYNKVKSFGSGYFYKCGNCGYQSKYLYKR